MQGDFSRDSFDLQRVFSRVLNQQGRVLLDSDWNEMQSIQLHLMRHIGEPHVAFSDTEGWAGKSKEPGPPVDVLVVPPVVQALPVSVQPSSPPSSKSAIGSAAACAIARTSRLDMIWLIGDTSRSALRAGSRGPAKARTPAASDVLD